MAQPSPSAKRIRIINRGSATQGQTMANDIKAIETTYRGYRFRSRLEARWAVYLDHLGLDWEYEKEGYHLDSGPYLPDFWIKDWQCWLEVKGTTPTREEQIKCEQLGEHSGFPVLLVDGLPEHTTKQVGYRTYHTNIYVGFSNDGGGGMSWFECFWAIDKNQTCVVALPFNSEHYMFSGPENYDLALPWLLLLQDIRRPMYVNILNKAKAARFEHWRQDHDMFDIDWMNYVLSPKERDMIKQHRSRKHIGVAI